MATLGDLLTFVRSQADADVTDAPDAVLTVHARIAYNDILSRRSAWEHLAVSYQFNTVGGTQDYALTGIGDLDFVSSVTYNQGGVIHRLTYVTMQDAELAYGSDQYTGVPYCYTVVNGTLSLFPKPDGVYTCRVRGYRNPTVWPNGVGSSPDLPDELHDAIGWYMLSGYYMSQEDTVMAGVYLQEFQAMVDKFLSGLIGKNSQPRPKIFGGGYMGGSYRFMDRVKGMVEG